MDRCGMVQLLKMSPFWSKFLVNLKIRIFYIFFSLKV